MGLFRGHGSVTGGVFFAPPAGLLTAFGPAFVTEHNDIKA